MSRGIVADNGAPGPNSALATQNFVNVPLPSTYFISATNKTAYSPLPTPQLNGAPNHAMSLGSTAPFNRSVPDAELQILEPPWSLRRPVFCEPEPPVQLAPPDSTCA